MNSIWFFVSRIFEQKSLPYGSTKPQEELEVFVRSGLIILALAASAAPASPQSGVKGHVAGLVFEDRNQDGSRDPGEPGIPGVVVCTRSDCVLSDAEGLYEVAVEPGYRVAWVSQPEGYRAKGGFYRRIPEDPFEWLVNFPLERAEGVSSFSFLHGSDTHVDAESLPRMRRLREIATEQGVDFVIITGDLIRDALRVPEETARERYELFRKEKEAFPVPVWVVPGNHENFGIERHKSGVSEDHPLYGKGMYERFLGPTYYSFNYGGVHFVGLDTADIDDRWYYGHVDETQLSWLERDLSHVSAETPVVTFNHIPFFSALLLSMGHDPESDPPGSVIVIDGKPQYRHVVSNFKDVLKKLEGKNYPLALAGHLHGREEIVLGDPDHPTRFHSTAAVVGPGGGDSGLNLVSGVTLYRVKDGVIDGGEFLAIDKPN
jgi:Icc-related predicted phosphoesterase